MARVFLIFTVLIGLGASFLSFKAKQQADERLAELQASREATTAAQAKQKKAEGDAEKARKELDETKADLATKEKEAADAKAAEQAAKADLAKATAEAEDKARKVAELEKALGESAPKMGEDPGKLAANIKELADAKAKLETELAEAQQLRDTFKRKAEDAEAQFAAKDRQIAEYKAGYIRNGLTGRIVAYNPGWNFVVLNLGDKAGLKSGAQMVVTRAGSLVGKVRVTTVEPNSAIADVLPGTIARGDSVQPGDSVVFEGQR